MSSRCVRQYDIPCALAKALLVLCGCALAGACGYEAIEGRAMGTTYAVQADCPDGVPRQRIVAILEQVDGRMSTYDSQSELSVFNRAPVGVPMRVSEDLAAVASAAQRIAEETGGAFDATVAPLVAFWGFGAEAAVDPPDEAGLRRARARVDFRQLTVSEQPPALEKRAAVTVDFSAIAKGYAVDRIADALAESSCRAYLVELGGEARVFGPAPDGGPWRLGIEAPNDAFDSDRLVPVLLLRNGAVATSGDYRQFRMPTPAEQRLLPPAQRRVSHIVDPRSGLPVSHTLAAVTVVAESAISADAYATALLVLGADAGLAFAESRDLAALFVERRGDRLELHRSTAMAKHLRTELSADSRS